MLRTALSRSVRVHAIRTIPLYHIPNNRYSTFQLPFPRSTSIDMKQILELENYKKIRPDVLKLQSSLRKSRKVHVSLTKIKLGSRK